MPGKIYLMHGDSELMPMTEAPYDSEKLLQEMIANHPDLLAGEQINSSEPRKWLLVTREMAVQGDEDDSPRWSLDHLFLDQDAVPTLIEVKKGTNTDIRRKVVGQMLDYAANAIVHWPVEGVRAKFESNCEYADKDPNEELVSIFGDDLDIDAFWQRVKTNLQAGRIRMVFLADSIPAELRRIVEFLNEQMDPAEVLAIEVKQFIGEGVKTLVPRVIGQTESARQKKSSSTMVEKKWEESMFMSALEEQKGVASRKAAEDILHWLTPLVTTMSWGTGSREGGIIAIIQQGSETYRLCRMVSQGWFVFPFDWLSKKPPFSDASVRQQLLGRINEIPGVTFNEDVLTKRARIPFEKLTTGIALEKLKAVLTWQIEQIRSERRNGSDPM